MITKTKYLVLTSIMLIVFIMFQFIGNSVDIFFSYDENEYAGYTPTVTAGDDAEARGSDYMCFANPAGRAAVVCGTDKNGESDIPGVTNACEYMNIEYEIYPRLTDIDTSDMDDFSLLVIGVSDLDLTADMEVITRFIDAKINIIFAVLPDLALIKESRPLRQLLGTQKVIADSVEVDGVTLFDGFLLGGKAILEETEEFEIPHFALFSSAEAYVMGILDDQDALGLDNEFLPHIVWRNSYNGVFVFTVNADYMKHGWGVGFFTAMLSEMCGNFVYPVINAQTLLLTNFPTLSAENTEEFTELYSQTSEFFFQTSVWPSVSSLLDQTGFTPTCFGLSRLSRTNSDTAKDSSYTSLMTFYIKQLRRHSGELGISAYDMDGDGARLPDDLELFARILPAYRFTVMHRGGLDDGETLAAIKSNEALSGVTSVVEGLGGDGVGKWRFIDDDTINIPVTNDGFTHTDDDEIALRSLQTALAASSIETDMKRLVYPEWDEDWSSLATDWARFTYTYWYPFRAFDRISVTDADARTRSFLTARYHTREEDGVIYIDADGFTGDGYLILDTERKKITATEGCEFSVIENDTYLIKMTEASAAVTLADKKTKDIG